VSDGERFIQYAVPKDFERHAAALLKKPSAQRMSHEAARQIAAPFAGSGHGVQLAPHEAGLESGTHAPSQLWNPRTQGYEHSPERHLATLLAGTSRVQSTHTSSPHSRGVPAQVGGPVPIAG
jgi:hypothetical protein